MTEAGILQLIAEGYFLRCSHDRYIVCENPEYSPDDGSDPCIFYDTKTDETITRV